ncbi:hypothetical protein [Psychromarinibacter sp. S121]|uniref:hypothetical protein n=1 Tax=Psychromarinibacter sp. S121 TaxID=3415127 RepID=UPI003C7E0B99
MGAAEDIRAAWARFADRRERHPQHTLFTHPLPAFPWPERRAVKPEPHVAIVTPCKDVAPTLPTYAALIDGLAYPKDRLHWIVLEGDSTDDSEIAVRSMLGVAGGYASTRFLKHNVGSGHVRASRTEAGLQRARRAAIASCRNRLLEAAMQTPAEYVLFIDADMAEIPSNAVARAVAWNAPVLAANCLRHQGDRVFDRNSFRYVRPPSDRSVRRFLRDGLYQPPTGFFRHYPSPGDGLRSLSCVGGTFLMIRRDVIEAGAKFPETPYQLHIETEGFALKAADLGFGSFMDADLIVRHGPH